MNDKGSRKDPADTVKKGGKLEDMVEYFSGVGHPHPISEVVEDLRQKMLSKGFDEVQTSDFLPLRDIKQLTGNLYPAFMDSIYHLSWLRMRPIAPSKEIEMVLNERDPGMDQARLWNILDAMDEDTSGEDLLGKLVDGLGISHTEAIAIMNMVPELTHGERVDEEETLRSFMPTSWISTLEATYDREAFPIRLFTIASLFRREPRQDSRHFRTYHILSIAILDEDMDLRKGKRILRRLFDLIELDDTRTIEKPYHFPYFEKGTELEIFGGDLELGTCGMVSRNVLGERNIDAPVFIADIGVERTLMYKHGYPDIRELYFPQFFAAWNLTDEEIAASIKYIRRPQTDYGREISNAIYKCYKENAESPEVNRKVAWSGILVGSDYGNFLVSRERAAEMRMQGRPAEVVLVEGAPGHGLTGPAAFNEVWVKDGEIIGAPPDLSRKMEVSGAIRTNRSYVKGFARLAAWKIEKAVGIGHTVKLLENVKDLEGMNMRLTSKALQYILSHKKKVDIRGPVYLKFLFHTSGSPKDLDE
ncbi:MAG: hypothetical protein JXA22_00415 [Candidatus Thermoplasmatota archaeon]|nr:hypothetical protein [Candidatus Thermoplasmatota archaeon]